MTIKNRKIPNGLCSSKNLNFTNAWFSHTCPRAYWDKYSLLAPKIYPYKSGLIEVTQTLNWLNEFVIYSIPRSSPNVILG